MAMRMFTGGMDIQDFGGYADIRGTRVSGGKACFHCAAIPESIQCV